jgi:hypothetical protein
MSLQTTTSNTGGSGDEGRWGCGLLAPHLPRPIFNFWGFC